MFSVYKSKSENLSTFENLSTLDLSTASLRPPDGSNNWSDRSNFFVRPNPEVNIYIFHNHTSFANSKSKSNH